MSIVNGNFNPVFGATQLRFIEQALSRSSKRISTGRKLNDAGDSPSSINAAGYHAKHLSGIRQAIINVEESMALMTAFDTTLISMEEQMIRLRDIALQASNDATLSPADFTNLNTEFQEIVGTINNTLLNAEYNDINLFNNNDFRAAPGRFIAYGPESTDVIGVYYGTPLTYYSATFFTLLGKNVSSAANAALALSAVDTAVNNNSKLRGGLGVFAATLPDALDALYTQEVNISAAYSAVVDADMAAEISNMASSQLLANSTTAMIAQANTTSSRITNLLSSL